MSETMTLSAYVGAGSQPHFSGFWGRLFAGATDLFVLMVALGIIQPFAPGVWYIVANLVIPFAYYAASLTLKSRTLGQWIFRQVTVTLNYERLPADVAIRRSAWVFLSYLFLGLPLLTILFSAKKQAFHDMMAKTLVIRQNISGTSGLVNR
jgi:uncharacterized RDD family membrane protein YckC